MANPTEFEKWHKEEFGEYPIRAGDTYSGTGEAYHWQGWQASRVQLLEAIAKPGVKYEAGQRLGKAYSNAALENECVITALEDAFVDVIRRIVKGE